MLTTNLVGTYRLLFYSSVTPVGTKSTQEFNPDTTLPPPRVVHPDWLGLETTLIICTSTLGLVIQANSPVLTLSQH